MKKDPILSPAINLYEGTSESVTVIPGANTVDIQLSAVNSSDTGNDDDTPITYTVIIAEGIENGTVIAKPYTATANETVTLILSANDGYEIGTYTVKDADGNNVLVNRTSTVGEYTFTMPESNVTVTATFTIIEATNITLDKTELTLTAGNYENLSITVAPETVTDYTVEWSTSDESVATVKDGIVTAVSAGTAVITASVKDLRATCTVTVTEEERIISFSGVAEYFDYEAENFLNKNYSITIEFDVDDTWGDIVEKYNNRIFTTDYDYAPAGKIVKIYVDDEFTVSAEIKSSEADDDTYNLVNINYKVSDYSISSYYLQF